MEELQIQVTKTLGTINTNFEEVEANLREVLANYKGIIVTEDTVKESKKDVAELRKIKTSIDSARKEVKKAWNAPYQEFEDKCKSLIALVDEPINEINSQVEIFQNKQIEEKREHLKELYYEHIAEFGEYIPFEVTLSDKWQNVSYADKDYVFDLSEKIVRIKSDLNAIKALNSEIEEEVLLAYRIGGNNLAAAIQKNSDFINAKKLAEKQLAEEKKAEEEKAAPEKQIAAIPEEGFMNSPVEETVEEETFTFRVSGNENIKKVKEFFAFAEIPFIEV